MSVDPEDTPGSTITSIKTEVARSLEHADANVRVHTTDYFNNSFAPDLVLSWPREGAERFVYLRTSANIAFLIQDVGLIDDSTSIVMPLSDITSAPAAEEGRQELQAASRSKRSLVTQPRSFESLGELRRQQPVAGLASRSLLQGGFGYIKPDDAVGFGRSLTTGFEAAQEANAEVTGSVVQQVEGLLDPARATEVNSFLHAVWVGSGAPGTSFPGAGGITATPTGAGLDLLLQTVTIDDPEFWANLARSLSFAKLAEMTATVDDANFQRLMHAGVNRLQAKAMRVVDGVPATWPGARWFLLDGNLGLRYGAVTAMFRPGGAKFDQSGVAVPTTMSQLQRRAKQARINLTDVTVGTQDRHLDYGSEDGGAITQDGQLAQFEAALGVRALVRKASARVGSRDLLADFTRSTANGRTAATFYLSELVEHLPLFANFSRSDISELLQTALGRTDPDSSE